MNFINKLNNSFELLNKIDNMVTRGTGKDIIKNQLLSLSEDLAKYKDFDKKNTEFDNDEIKLKITDLLKKINKIETIIKNKLIITEKYNSYLNS